MIVIILFYLYYHSYYPIIMSYINTTDEQIDAENRCCMCGDLCDEQIQACGPCVRSPPSRPWYYETQIDK